MQSKIPLYPYSAKDAMKRGEIEKWRESFRENCACAGGIDILIRENFDGMHLKDGTVEKIVELYGYKRVEHVLANTVQERRGDGRFRPDNRAWAESHYIPEDEMHNYCFAARSHSAILDASFQTTESSSWILECSTRSSANRIRANWITPVRCLSSRPIP